MYFPFESPVLRGSPSFGPAAHDIPDIFRHVALIIPSNEFNFLIFVYVGKKIRLRFLPRLLQPPPPLPPHRPLVDILTRPRRRATAAASIHLSPAASLTPTYTSCTSSKPLIWFLLCESFHSRGSVAFIYWSGLCLGHSRFPGEPQDFKHHGPPCTRRGQDTYLP